MLCGLACLHADKNVNENTSNIKPAQPILNRILGEATALYESQKYQEAINILKRGLEISDEHNVSNEIITSNLLAYKGLNEKKLGKDSEALKSYKSCYMIRLDKLRDLHPLTLETDLDLGLLYYRTGNHQKAVYHLERVVTNKSKSLGESLMLGDIYSFLGKFYKDIGNLKLSINYDLEALSIFEKRLGSDDKELIYCHQNLGFTYNLDNNTRRALFHFEKALVIRKKQNKKSLLDIALYQNLIGQLYSNIGDHTSALKYQKEALENLIQIHGLFHHEVAKSFSSIGFTYLNLGDSTNGLKFHEKSLDIREKLFEGADPELAIGYSNLGNANMLEGNLILALDLFKKGTQIDQELFGENHPRVIQGFNNIGFIYSRTGKSKKALSIYNRSLKLITDMNVTKEEKINFSRLEDATSRLIAECYFDMGKYSTGIDFLKKCLSSTLKRESPMYSDIAYIYNNFGKYYQETGEIYLAKINFQKALEVFEFNLGKNHVTVALCLSNLGWIQNLMGEYKQSISSISRSLEIQKAVLDPGHLDIGNSYNNLIVPYAHLGNFSKSEDCFNEALRIIKASGQNPFRLPAVYNNGALLYGMSGKYAKSINYTKKSIELEKELNGVEFVNVGISLFKLGTYYIFNNQPEQSLDPLSEAIKILKKSLEESHPSVIEAKQAKMMAFYLCNKSEEAKKLALRISDLQEDFISRIFKKLPERERLKSLNNDDPFFLLGNLDDINHLSLTAIRRKGLVLDTILEDRKIHGSKFGNKKQSLIQERKKISNDLILLRERSIQDSRSYIDLFEKLEDKLNELDKKIFEPSTTQKKSIRAFSLAIKDIEEVIPKNNLLVDFIKYRDIEKSVPKFQILPSSGAIIYSRDFNKPKFINLGHCTPIETLIRDFKEKLSGTGRVDKSDLENLFSLIIQPIMFHTPGNTKSIIVSPDSELNFVPFPALIDKNGTFLCEKYDIKNVSAIRDLISFNKRGPEKYELSIFSDPVFENFLDEETTTFSTNNVNGSAFRNLGFTRLPGTKKEAEELSKVCSSNGFFVNSFSRIKATEKNLRSIKAPRFNLLLMAFSSLLKTKKS